MLTRRVYASVRSALPAQHSVAINSRSFTALAAAQSPARAPALADVRPDGAAAFSEKQQEFREGLITAQKQQEQRESQSCSPNLPVAMPLLARVNVYRQRSWHH